MHPFAPLDQAAGYAELFADLEARAVRDHRLRRGVAAAQRRLAGRARRPARHPRLPREPRRGRARRVPHPGVGARHQRRERGDGGHARRRRGVRRRRQRRLRRPQDEGARARGRPRRAHGHVPVDPRRVRGAHRRRLRRSCTSCGGQVYLDGANLNALVGVAKPGHVRRRRVAPQPAQDVLHPARRGRAGRRPGGGARAPRAVPAAVTSPAAPWGSAGILPISCLVHPADGRRRPAPRHPGRDPQRQLRRGAAARPHYPVLYTGPRAWSPTSASSTCARSRRPPASPSTTSPSGSSTTASTRPRCRSRSPAR